MTILSKEAILEEFGSTFEHSPWIADAAFEAGAFQGIVRAADGVVRLEPREAERIHAAMCEAFRAAPREKRLEVLNAHPDLAGRLAVEDALTEDSKAEQAGAGLDRLTPDEHGRFSELNERYTRMFGHPFIVAVKGLGKADILSQFGRRLENGADEEFETACREVEKIAALRLDARTEGSA